MKRLLAALGASVSFAVSLESAVIVSPRPEPVQAAEAPNILRGFQEAVLFRNGDILGGSLERISSNHVAWRHPDALELITLAAGNLAELQLKAEPKSHQSSANSCVVRLVNSDQLEGDVLSLTASNLTLRTWYAGEIMIPRSMLQSISPSGPNRSTIFQGPTTLDGWTSGQTNALLPGSGKWIYRNGAFYASKSASIARDVKLPDVASLSFDMTWKGYFQLAIALYTHRLQPVSLANKESEPDFGGFYSLQLNTFSANLLPITHKDPIRYLGQASMLALSQKTSAHFEIRIHKPKRLFALLINGEIVKEWIDPSPFAGSGSAIRFVHQGQGLVKIENIQVTEWDGQYDDKGPISPPPSQDLARLRNGDRVLGELKGIENGVAILNRPEGRMEIPLARAKRFDLAARGTGTPPTEPSAARVHFARGGSLTITIDEWTSEGIKASSPAFGPVTLHPRAFSRLEFAPQ